MSARVTLQVLRGPLKGQDFVFEERTMCIVGRAKDCHPYIPTPKGQHSISRHHCLLDINPPDIRIRDFGSLNGTFVNGKKIGQRQKHQSPHEVDVSGFAECDLKDGDRVRLGKTVLRVSVLAPTLRETFLPVPVRPPETEIESADHGSPPAPPRARTATPSHGPHQAVAGMVCDRCGRGVSGDVSQVHQGEYICAQCRADPLGLLKQLIDRACAGDKELVAIRGFELVRELGQGGMGAVYLAREHASGRHVALKVLLPNIAATPRSTDAFLREANNTRSLQHPNIVRLYETGCSRGIFFLTLEFCDGASVDRLMARRGGKLSIAEAGKLILQALDGLAYAHSALIPHVKLKDGNIVQGRGLVHRDVKPANLFLCGSGAQQIAKIGDYGLSKAFDLAGLSGHTYTGDVGGTPHFMPRQQVLNFRDAGPEVDVWAMAASLYNMLTGEVPRHFSRTQDPWHVVLHTDPIPIRQRELSVPKKLAEVIDHALRDNPEIGFRTAKELRKALEQAL
jgi:eukaryotic-like serine/threonine-protein kinase